MFRRIAALMRPASIRKKDGFASGSWMVDRGEITLAEYRATVAAVDSK